MAEMSQPYQVEAAKKIVPEGYKQTEVGVIPQDWEHKVLGDLASIYSGGTPNRKIDEYWGGDIPWVTTTLINGKLIEHANEFITHKGLEGSSAKWCRTGTILMAMYGQGKTRGKVAVLGFDTTINQACAAIELKESITSNYVFHTLKSMYEEIRELSNSGGQENLSSGIIKNIRIPYPPKKEQTVIANALSDTDALLSELEKLIAKKQAIKTATMQQLLTGRTRLPQFAHHPDGSKKGYKQSELGEIPEDWENVPLGSLLSDFRNGYSFSAQGYVRNGTPIITMGQISLSGRFQFDLSKVNHWRVSDLNKLKDFWVRDGDLLIAMTDVTPDKNLIGQMTIAKLDGIALLNQRVGLLRIDENKGISIFYSYLSNLPAWKTYCKGVASLGVQANISTSDIKEPLKISAYY